MEKRTRNYMNGAKEKPVVEQALPLLFQKKNSGKTTGTSTKSSTTSQTQSSSSSSRSSSTQEGKASTGTSKKISRTGSGRERGRSEERFSRNAETDLVCRLLLEKKK
eukprot:TRINITY_DN22278_c0_g1_i9.p1 TRINITY_DN22278_c0_g1~~TRINITY_DN22278_c0_g1_i9.p1  ORF type:complete len:107 (-),score=16.83 TRINITY_DN22278_c0_g1_i9:5-325(-)